MTIAEVEASPEGSKSLRREAMKSVTACAFCRRRLSDEFYFTCLKCHASYCYIHISRHPSARCERKVARANRSLEEANLGPRVEGLPQSLGSQLLLASQRPGPGSSANV